MLIDDYVCEWQKPPFHALLSSILCNICDTDQVNQKTNIHVSPKYGQNILLYRIVRLNRTVLMIYVFIILRWILAKTSSE